MEACPLDPESATGDEEKEYPCPRALMWRHPLKPGNELAMRLYPRVCSQLAYDFHLSEAVLLDHGFAPGTSERREMLDRLSLIHAERTRRKKKQNNTQSDE